MSTPDPDTLLAETRAFNVELERMLATIPSVHTVPPAESVRLDARAAASSPRRCTFRRRA